MQRGTDLRKSQDLVLEHWQSAAPEDRTALILEWMRLRELGEEAAAAGEQAPEADHGDRPADGPAPGDDQAGG